VVVVYDFGSLEEHSQVIIGCSVKATDLVKEVD